MDLTDQRARIHRLVDETDDPVVLDHLELTLTRRGSDDAADVVAHQIDGTPVRLAEERELLQREVSRRGDGTSVPLHEARRRFGL